jgi:hypothetical protein
MQNDDLARIRNDLDVVQSALGLPQPAPPIERKIYLLFAAAGLLALVWALVPHRFPAALGFCAFIPPVALWLRFARAEASDKECRGALRTLWLMVPILALFVWCRLMDLSPLVFLGLTTFLVGALLFSAAVGEPHWRSIVGWAMALMMGGLALPLPAPPLAVLAGALALGGLISAALLTFTREPSSNHAPS